jgi:hypothetical protein
MLIPLLGVGLWGRGRDRILAAFTAACASAETHLASRQEKRVIIIIMLIPLIHGLSYSIIETQNLCVQRLHFLALLRTFFMDQTFETLVQENETLLLGHLLTRLLADVSE